LFNGMFGVMSEGNGLYFMRARFYSAQVKRFVNRDVLVGNVALGQSLNRFAFVAGNPVNYLDPFGLEPWDWDGQGDTSICQYYDEMTVQNPKCGYYPIAANICRGISFRGQLVVNVVDLGLRHAWLFLGLQDSQSSVYNNIRGILIWEDQARRHEGRIDSNGCVFGNDIDHYHNLAFEFAGLSTYFYGGNLWPQQTWPNPVPFDPHNLCQ